MKKLCFRKNHFKYLQSPDLHAPTLSCYSSEDWKDKHPASKNQSLCSIQTLIQGKIRTRAQLIARSILDPPSSGTATHFRNCGGLFPQPSHTSLPSIIVAMTWTESICCTGIRVKSLSSTARSASIPGLISPLRSFSSEAKAPE